MDFTALVDIISTVHLEMSKQSTKAVNICLTLRNWLMGYYIEIYEREGVDRSSYGEHLMDDLAKVLHKKGMERLVRLCNFLPLPC